MVRARRVIYSVTTGRTKVETFKFTPPPPPPKNYVIYKPKRLRSGKEVRLHVQVVGPLTRDEIDELRADGWKVEEVPR